MYYGAALDNKRRLKWNLIAWEDKKKGNNEDLIQCNVNNGKNKV